MNISVTYNLLSLFKFNPISITQKIPIREDMKVSKLILIGFTIDQNVEV